MMVALPNIAGALCSTTSSQHSLFIIIIIIIDTFIKRHKCLGYRGAGVDVNQADCRNRKVFSWRLKPCSESHSVMFAGRLFQVTGAA